MKKPITINGYTFSEFCSEVRGWNFYQKNGFQIYKYELFFFKREDPKSLTNNRTKYAKREISK